jgi:hypothetical protein
MHAIDYRGCIEVDEVDGRSPVERAAATFFAQAAQTQPLTRDQPFARSD